MKYISMRICNGLIDQGLAIFARLDFQPDHAFFYTMALLVTNLVVSQYIMKVHVVSDSQGLVDLCSHAVRLEESITCLMSEKIFLRNVLRSLKYLYRLKVKVV